MPYPSPKIDRVFANVSKISVDGMFSKSLAVSLCNQLQMYLLEQMWHGIKLYVCFILVRDMDNFYVFGSNLSFPSPPLVTLLGAPHQLCGQYSGTPPMGQISRVTCEPHPIRARYVFIQVDHQAAPSVLELCEVWVYGSECLQRFIHMTWIDIK